MRAVRFAGVGRARSDCGCSEAVARSGADSAEDRWSGRLPFGSARDGGRIRLQGTLSFTLGHENAGWVAELGGGVTAFKEGDAVAVYGPWGCGRCHACQLSMENYCENWAEIKGFGGGLGLDGGMAEYMLVPAARSVGPPWRSQSGEGRSTERRRVDSLSRHQTRAATSPRGQHRRRDRRRRPGTYGDPTASCPRATAHRCC